MRLMVTGGGTAGHTSPAIAIIEEIQQRDERLDLQWVGCADSVEQRVCKTLSIPFRTVAVRGWPRSGALHRGTALARLGVGGVQAYGHVKRFRPQVVLGVGGYVSVPLVYIAQRTGVPTVLHEQNKRLGMANRLLAPRAKTLLLSFPETSGAFSADRALVVGNPVRGGFLRPPGHEDACKRLDLNPDIPIVLVVGGSQGAKTLNDAMRDALPNCAPDELQFVWMTGPHGVEEARRAAEKAPVPTRVYAFIDDMVGACVAATLIVSRAGASSTAEIAALGKPSILAPYPFATDNHQEANARAFEEAGAARVLLDEACTGDRLLTTLRDMLADAHGLERMGNAAHTLARPAAVETIVESIFSAAFPDPPS